MQILCKLLKQNLKIWKKGKLNFKRCKNKKQNLKKMKKIETKFNKDAKNLAKFQKIKKIKPIFSKLLQKIEAKPRRCRKFQTKLNRCKD